MIDKLIHYVFMLLIYFRTDCLAKQLLFIQLYILKIPFLQPSNSAHCEGITKGGGWSETIILQYSIHISTRPSSHIKTNYSTNYYCINMLGTSLYSNCNTEYLILDLFSAFMFKIRLQSWIIILISLHHFPKSFRKIYFLLIIV